MKKNILVTLIAVSALLALNGCGKDDDTPKRPDDIAVSIEPTVTVPSTIDPVEVPDEVLSETPPEEGMVHSALTNEWIYKDVADSRPISVMFPTDRGSQPQYGIGLAGVLYECMEEGEMSRQMGVIEDWQDLELIGNIRSCRDYYAYWSMEWEAAFCGIPLWEPAWEAGVCCVSFGMPDLEAVVCRVSFRMSAPGSETVFCFVSFRVPTSSPMLPAGGSRGTSDRPAWEMSWEGPAPEEASVFRGDVAKASVMPNIRSSAAAPAIQVIFLYFMIITILSSVAFLLNPL